MRTYTIIDETPGYKSIKERDDVTGHVAHLAFIPINNHGLTAEYVRLILEQAYEAGVRDAVRRLQDAADAVAVEMDEKRDWTVQDVLSREG